MRQDKLLRTTESSKPHEFIVTPIPEPGQKYLPSDGSMPTYQTQRTRKPFKPPTKTWERTTSWFIYSVQKHQVAVLNPDQLVTKEPRNGAHNNAQQKTPNLEPGSLLEPCWRTSHRFLHTT